MIDQYPPANGVLTSLIWRKTAAGGETSLSGYDNASQALSYTPGQEQVYLNGILLVRGDDYTATNGTSITGLTALAANDFVQVNCYNNFSVATLPTSGLTGTISNAQLQNSSITINGNSVSLGGSVSLPGDIESVTAGTGLTGGGNSGAVTLGLSTPVATTNGGTGLSTFTTGDLVYASGSNTLASRSIGSTGQVLTVSGGLPTWSTPSTGSYTLLSSGTIPSSGLTLTSINQTYQDLLFQVYGVTWSTSSYYGVWFNSLSAAVRNSYTIWGGGDGPASSISGTYIRFDTNTWSTSANNSLMIRMYNYTDTSAYKTFQFWGLMNNGTTDYAMNGGGAWKTNNAIDRVDVMNAPGGANFTAGSYRLWGIK